MLQNAVRPVVGLLSIVLVGVVVAAAVTMFRGGFTDSVAVTVLSPRAGLVMNPDADVKMRGVTVGSVESIEDRADGLAELHLAMDTGRVDVIPADVSVDIASTTVFGAKFVQLIPPEKSSGGSMYAGQVLDAEHVTVEINTVFEQLTSVLGRIQPEKLNETLGAIAAATNGRGERVGQMLTDLEQFLEQVDPALPALERDLNAAPEVARTYADTAPDLVGIADKATDIGQTIVDEQRNLDAMLVSMIGLGDVGERVLGGNREALANLLDVLVPTTTLTREYEESLTCSLTGFATLADAEPVDVPGLGLSANFLWGTEPYEHPKNLPKVAASGGPQCSVIPVPYEGRPPFVVTDVGANPFERGNQELQLNVDSLSRALFGPPSDGAPTP